MPTYEVEVLDSFAFESRDTKKSGTVEVVAKKVSYDDGTRKTFIERRLRIGERFVALPYDSLASLQEALGFGYARAEERFSALVSRRKG